MFPVDAAYKQGDAILPTCICRVRIGGDMAVLKGMMKVMLERERSAPGISL